MSVSIELAREWRAQAWRDYDNAKEDAPALRDAYIDRMYEKMSEDMDINCGSIAEGKENIKEVGQKIFPQPRALIRVIVRI